MHSSNFLLVVSFIQLGLCSPAPQRPAPPGASNGTLPTSAPASKAPLKTGLPLESSQASPGSTPASGNLSASTIKVAQSAAVNTAGAATGSTSYTQYNGDGSTGAGWPSIDKWILFADAFDANKGVMQSSCTQFGQPNDSSDEINDIQEAIKASAASTGVDARFILAVIMNESSGCVRAPTTPNKPPNPSNPGLMQSFGGTTCFGINDCPPNKITQMTEDGAGGVGGKAGLQQGLASAPASAIAQKTYQAGRIYNSGSLDPSGDLALNAAKSCYASDLANRLIGFVGASPCQ